MNLDLVLQNAALVLTMMTLLWLVSVRIKDVSIVDPWWSIGFLLVAANSVRQSELSFAKILMLAVVSAWALRLWAYLLIRSRGKVEDTRYTAFRERFGRERYWWFSFFQVFLLQGALVLIVSAPLQVAGAARNPDALEWNDILGAIIATVGIAFEAIGDGQLARFKRDPQNRGKVCDQGLWRYTRHPNYFGEALIAVGFFLFAIDAPWGALTIFAPVLMITLLLRVSGVSMLDEHMLKTKPDYARYLQTTSAFWPRAPKH